MTLANDSVLPSLGDVPQHHINPATTNKHGTEHNQENTVTLTVTQRFLGSMGFWLQYFQWSLGGEKSLRRHIVSLVSSS